MSEERVGAPHGRELLPLGTNKSKSKSKQEQELAPMGRSYGEYVGHEFNAYMTMLTAKRVLSSARKRLLRQS